jgi:CheY-like chemotaxis protein
LLDDVRDTAVHRILVVEDNPLVGMLLAEMLEQMGHTVCGVAATEQAAIAAAAEQLPDLIIADAKLGNGSGLAAVSEILLLHDVAHIFMSGDIASLAERRPHAVLLEKPFQPQDLQRGILRAFSSASRLVNGSAA